MTYDELNALYQQGQTGETFYDEQGNPYTFNDVRLPDGGVLSRRPDGMLRVETHNDGRGRGGGYDIYPDGRQEPFGFDKYRSNSQQFLDVAGPVLAVGGLGALASSGMLGSALAGSGGTAGAVGSSITPEIGATIAGAGDAGIAGGSLGGGLTAGTFGTGTLPTTLGMGTVGESFIGMPSIADGTLSAADIFGGGGAVLGGGFGVPGGFGAPGATGGGFGAPSLSNAAGMASGAGTDWMSALTNPALLAGAAGAVAGVAGNSDITSSQTGTTSGATNATQSSSGSQGLAPWLQGYAQDYVGRAQSLANAPSSNAAMDAGRGLLANAAMQGDPLVNAARGQQQNLIGGGMLNANPYIGQVAQNIGDRMGDAYARGTAANTDATFARAKAFGGSAWDEQQRANQQAFGDSLGNTMSNLYYGNYQGERAAQDAASRGSLGFGQFGANAANNLYNVGAQDFQRPFAQNAQYGAAIQPAFGSQTQNMANTTGQTNANTTQNSTMQAPNNFLAGAGGAMNALALYRMYTGGR